MSALSSAESWAGGGAGGAPDIIDLDRYMRGNVRPRMHRLDDNLGRLVVDAGGGHTAAPATLPPPPPPYKPTSVSSKSSTRRGKRYSHDSGLSDGSDNFERRRHRRTVTESVSGRSRSQDERRSRAGRSTDSLKNFKLDCERALRDQQEQIARVAQLCERLTTSAGEGAGGSRSLAGGGGGGGGRGPWVAAARRAAAAPAHRGQRRASLDAAPVDNESTDISSSNSSHSTRGRSKKDRHRSDECKTYKIIMTKLDELNRMFAYRRVAPPAPPAPVARRPPSTGTVSVSDKVVATDSPHRTDNCIAAYALTTTEYRPYLTPTSRRTSAMERGVGCGPNAVSRLATARTHELDIAPAPAPPPARPAAPAPVRLATAAAPAVRRSGFLNVGTESVLQCGSEDGSGCSAHAPTCHFDLDDPVHLYAQAKRLPGAGAAYASRADRPPPPPPPAARTAHCDVAHCSDSEKSNVHVHKSLCGLCKSYWRALAGLAAQFFNKPES